MARRWWCCRSTHRAGWTVRRARSSRPSWLLPCRWRPGSHPAARARRAPAPTSSTPATSPRWPPAPTLVRPRRCRLAACLAPSRSPRPPGRPRRRCRRTRPARPRPAMARVPPIPAQMRCGARSSTTPPPTCARWRRCAAATSTGPSVRCAPAPACRPKRRSGNRWSISSPPIWPGCCSRRTDAACRWPTARRVPSAARAPSRPRSSPTGAPSCSA